MQNPLLGLRTAVYNVSDLHEATVWYSIVLGIDPYFNEPYYVGFNVGGFELGLVPNPELDKEAKARSVEVYWGVEDIQAKYDDLIDHGATTCEVPTDVGGGIFVASVFDPWGNLFSIIFNPHFKLPEVGAETGI
jgi:predicted enzyme related to lactoylglutathione lyase